MSLSRVPDGARAFGVQAAPDASFGRPALRVALDKTRRAGTLGIDFGDEPTFLALPGAFAQGTIAVDLRARLLPDAPDYARAFVGLAFGITLDPAGAVTGFQAVYLRPLNGIVLDPPAPRADRAVQWFSYPDWKFDRLREAHPGRFESAANISPDQWHQLEVDIGINTVRARVDGVTLLDLFDLPQAPVSGLVGLWVDIGTDAWFSDLTLSSR